MNLAPTSHGTKQTPLRTAFLGTPDFAAQSLLALIEAGIPPVVVITAPDRPAGRGQKLKQSAVKEVALEAGIPILQPEKLKNPAFLEELKAFELALGIVVAFRMLPKEVFKMPTMGMFNLHASLLPKYRGAAPINWAIAHGETETGVTTFQIEQEIDTGGIYLQETVQIKPNMNVGELHDALARVGAELVVKTVQGLTTGNLLALPQPELHSFPAPKLNRENTKLSFAQPSDQVHNFVRAFSPTPGAHTILDGKQLKVIKGEAIMIEHTQREGTVLAVDHSIVVACTQGAYAILELQLEGKKVMDSAAFLRGYAINVGDFLGENEAIVS